MKPPVRPRRTAPVRGEAGAPAARTPGTPVARPPVEERAPGRPTSTSANRADAGAARRPTTTGSRPPATGATRPRAVAAGSGTPSGPTVVRPSLPVRPPVVSPRSAERFAERVALRRRLTRRRIVIGSVTAVVAGGLAWLLLVSPVLALDPAQVEIRGEGTVVDTDAVAAVVAERAGTPLPRLDTVGLRREVLDVPGVRAAEVERRWPDGLRLTLVSREPVAAVPRDGSFALLDVEGVQVGRVGEAPETLPVVDVPAGDDGSVRALTAVLAVLERLPEDLADQVREVSARTQDTVRLVLADGVRVEWGSADETSLKAEVLRTLLASEATEGVRVVDVSAPRMPITTS